MEHTEFLSGLRSRLGVTDAAATEETILAALDESLAERADPPATLPEGVVAIESGVLAQLTADAAAGRQALVNQETARRDRVIVDALRAGKITAAQRGQWRASLDKDEQGITALLATMAAVVPVDPKVINAATDDEQFYASIYGEKA